MSEQDHRPDDESPPHAQGLPRRSLLKGTAGILAAGLFPAVHAQEKIVPTGNLKGIDTKRIKNSDKITPLFTRGVIGDKKVGDQGTAPKKVIFLEGEKSKVFAKQPTQWMSLIPTVYNADTLGIRPDLVKRP